MLAITAMLVSVGQVRAAEPTSGWHRTWQGGFTGGDTANSWKDIDANNDAFNGSGSPTLDTISSTGHSGFAAKSYGFAGGNEKMNHGNFGSTNMDDSVTFEIWFKLDGLTNGDQTLFESGGNFRGVSFTIGDGGLGGDANDDDLRFRIGGSRATGTDATITVDITGPLPVN